MHKIIVIGNVGRDPEVKFSKAGKPWATFSIASNEGGKGDEKQTEWFNCKAFGPSAESIGEHVTKGTRLWVEGRLSTHEHDGKKYTDLMVDRWQFVDGKGDGKRGERRPAPQSRNDEPPPPADEDLPF